MGTIETNEKTEPKEGKGTKIAPLPLLFQARFRKFRQQLKLADGTFKQAVFDNYVLLVPDLESNKAFIEALRERAGRDYLEVDTQKKAADEDARDAELKALRAKVAQLELLQDNVAPRVRLKPTKKTE